MTRDEEKEYANKAGLELREVGNNRVYSIDRNLWGLAIEGEDLEDTWVAPPEDAFSWTSSIDNAPEEHEIIDIEFEKGIPISLNNKKMSGVKLIDELNIIAGKHGVGRVDHLENRFIGIKSRGIYETPGGTLLMTAHRAIESITLDKETMHKKDEIMSKYAKLIYNGYWYSKSRLKLQKIIDLKKNKVNGSIKLKLYKGNITIISRQTKSNAYSIKKVSFEENKTFNKSNVERFIDFHKKKLFR